MIKTTGKRDPARVAEAEKKANRQRAMDKRPPKRIDQLTAQEKKDALDAMLEWFLSLD